METITPGVHQVHETVNAFIVDGDEGVTLVDTGLPRRHGAILGGLSAIGRSVADVIGIVLTHSHADHVGGAQALAADSGAPVYASEADAPAISGDAPVPLPPLTDRVPFLAPLLRRLPAADPVTVDHSFSSEERPTLPSDLRAVDTPGHTPGHTSYLLDRGGGVMFVGDAALAKNGEVVRGWFNSARPAIHASIAHLGTLEYQIACFGHSRPILSGAADAFRRARI